MTVGPIENPRLKLIEKIGSDYVPPRLPPFLLQHISSPSTGVHESMRLTDSILVHANQYKPKAIANVMFHAISRMQKQAEAMEGGLWVEDENSLLVKYSNWEGNFSNIEALAKYRRDHGTEVAEVQSHLLKQLVRSPDISYETLQDFGMPLAKDLTLKTGKFSYAVKLQEGLVAKANKEDLFDDVHETERFKQQTRELADHALQVGHRFAVGENDPGLSDNWHKKATLAAARMHVVSGEFNLARSVSLECQTEDPNVRSQVQRIILRSIVQFVPTDLLPYYFETVNKFIAEDDSLRLYFALALMGREDSFNEKSMSKKNARTLLSKMDILKEDRLVSQINLIYGNVESYVDLLIKRNINRENPKAEFLTHALKKPSIETEAVKQFDRDIALVDEAFQLMFPHDGLVKVILQTSHEGFKKQCIAKVIKMVTSRGENKVESEGEVASPSNIYLNKVLNMEDVQDLWGGPVRCFNDEEYVKLLDLANRNSKVKRRGVIYKYDSPERAARIAQLNKSKWEPTPSGD